MNRDAYALLCNLRDGDRTTTDEAALIDAMMHDDAQRQWAEMGAEQERDALDALRACDRAGAPDDALDTLAAMLGVRTQFRRMARP